MLPCSMRVDSKSQFVASSQMLSASKVSVSGHTDPQVEDTFFLG